MASPTFIVLTRHPHGHLLISLVAVDGGEREQVWLLAEAETPLDAVRMFFFVRDSKVPKQPEFAVMEWRLEFEGRRVLTYDELIPHSEFGRYIRAMERRQWEEAAAYARIPGRKKRRRHDAPGGS